MPLSIASPSGSDQNALDMTLCRCLPRLRPAHVLVETADERSCLRKNHTLLTFWSDMIGRRCLMFGFVVSEQGLHPILLPRAASLPKHILIRASTCTLSHPVHTTTRHFFGPAFVFRYPGIHSGVQSEASFPPRPIHSSVNDHDPAITIQSPISRSICPRTSETLQTTNY